MASSAEQKSVAPNNFLSAGRGLVPSMPSLLTAASKQFCEAASEGDTLVYHGMTRMLDFSREGVSPDELRAFLHEALDAGRSHEPTVESGNKYGVSDQVRKDYDLIPSVVSSTFTQSQRYTRAPYSHAPPHLPFTHTISSSQFHTLNSELIMTAIQHGASYKALSTYVHSSW